MLKDFWKKAQRYIDKNKDCAEKPNNFIYKNSEIEPELLILLLSMKDSCDYYSEEYDRAYDYSRLLKLENDDLKHYINELEQLLDEKDNTITIDMTGGEMVS